MNIESKPNEKKSKTNSLVKFIFNQFLKSFFEIGGSTAEKVTKNIFFKDNDK